MGKLRHDHPASTPTARNHSMALVPGKALMEGGMGIQRRWWKGEADRGRQGRRAWCLTLHSTLDGSDSTQRAWPGNGDNCLPRAIWGLGNRGGKAVKDSLTRNDESCGGVGLDSSLPATQYVCVCVWVCVCVKGVCLWLTHFQLRNSVSKHWIKKPSYTTFLPILDT